MNTTEISKKHGGRNAIIFYQLSYMVKSENIHSCCFPTFQFLRGDGLSYCWLEKGKGADSLV